MKTLVPRVILTVLLLVLAVYLGDYLRIRYKIWRDQVPYDTVTIQITYAIAEKAPRGSQKTEFASGGTLDQTCVHSLFPHFGYSPCWYLKSKTQQQVNM